MRTHDDGPRPANPPNTTLVWAFDDQHAPAEMTLFDPRSEITTHWITIDKEYVYDLDDTA